MIHTSMQATCSSYNNLSTTSIVSGSRGRFLGEGQDGNDGTSCGLQSVLVGESMMGGGGRGGEEQARGREIWYYRCVCMFFQG